MMFAKLHDCQGLRAIASSMRIALVIGVSLGLAGCYDQAARVSFKPDGQAELKIDIDLSPDAKDLIAWTDALIQLTPEGSALFDGGLCKSIGTLSTMSPNAAVLLTAEQVTAPDKVSCKVSAALGPSQDAADKMAMLFAAAADPARSNVLSITRQGERRLRIAIDFSRSGVPQEVMRAAMVGVAAAAGQRLNDDAVDRVVSTFVPAMVSMGKLMGDKRGFTFAIDALKVIETNGEQRGNSVVFRWSWEEFIRRQFKAEGVDNKVYYAVIEY